MAFDEYFTTVAEYNRAQFELFHALGYPAREVAALPAARRGPAGGHGAAGLPAPGGQRAAPGHPMSAPSPGNEGCGLGFPWSSEGLHSCSRRLIHKYRPVVERLEEKQLLSAGPFAD